MSCYYDVVVLGGGFNGVLCGLELHNSGISVLVLEKNEELLQNTKGRVFALSKKSKDILELFRIWNKKIKNAPIEHIITRDGHSCSHVNYNHSYIENGPMGYVVNAEDLAVIMKQKAMFDVFTSSNYKSFSFSSGFVEICLEDGRRIKTRLIICAEGKNSRFRESASMRTIKYDFGQSCFICNLNHTKNHNNVAIEHFYKGGPFAILPMSGGFSSSITLTEKSDKAELLRRLSAEDFRRELQKKCTGFIGEIEISSKVQCFDISMIISEKQYSKRAILLGDAAHAIHPIAGQGLNMGIRDVYVSTEIIKKYHKLGSDIGQEFILKEIENRRILDNFSMSFMTTAINHIFSSDSLLFKIARRTIMSAVEMSLPVKKTLIRHAMGISSISR